MWIPARVLRNERGIALVVVLLVALAVAAISAAAALISSNQSLISRYNDRQSALESVADQGLEEGRARVNGDRTLYPAQDYTVLEDGVAPVGADGAAIPNLRRWTYVGPTGVTSGQYGVFGSVVTVVEDAYRNKMVRRGEIVQESFAKYAYFTDDEGTVQFGGGDQIYGPVHSNDDLTIHASGATFFGTVETARSVVNAGSGTFHQGYQQNVPRIDLPTTADLTKLLTQANQGNTTIAGNLAGAAGTATTRIEFIAIDLNADGDVTDGNEGFMRVYQSADARWVVGKVPTDFGTPYSGLPNNGLMNARNCGHVDPDGVFRSARQHNPVPAAPANHSWLTAVTTLQPRCYLGGDPVLTNGFVANDPIVPGGGAWLTWPGAPVAAVAARPDGAYLFPITRALNPSFKGVIYVSGNVAVSGVLRGEVTLAATGAIVIADDLTYATDPGAGTCQDILGLFAQTTVVVSDNTLNTPIRPAPAPQLFVGYDDSRDEFIHGVILALDLFTVDNFGGPAGVNTAQPCGTTIWGRGCLFVTGGIIQRQRGVVGQSNMGGGFGYIKRYSYDACAYTNPPPYFPTTGHFARARQFEVDPTGFDVARYYRLLTPPSD